MALVEPGPFEKLVLWLKSLAKVPARHAVSRLTQDRTVDVVWSKPLDSERWIEVLAREDGLFSFREMKRVKDGEYEFDIPLHESGLYSDMKEIVAAVDTHMNNCAVRPN